MSKEPVETCGRCGQAPRVEAYRPSCPVCGWSAPEPLTFAAFSAANRLRCERDFGEPLDASSQYTPAHWALTVAEEVGEIAAAVLGVAGLKKRKAHLTVADIGDEIADAVSYLDLLATRLGLDLSTVLAGKFNRVSERIGSDVRIDGRQDLAAAETNRESQGGEQDERLPQKPVPLVRGTPAAAEISTPQGTAGAVDAPATAGPTAAAESQRASVGLDPEGSAAAPVVHEHCGADTADGCICGDFVDGGSR